MKRRRIDEARVLVAVVQRGEATIAEIAETSGLDNLDVLSAVRCLRRVDRLFWRVDPVDPRRTLYTTRRSS